MGFNTIVHIHNDALGAIREHPQEFVDGIAHALNDGGDIRVANYVNAAQVVKTAHADTTQLIASGGNHATLLGEVWGHHHRQDDQVKLLKQWADLLGYRISKKPGTS